MDVPYNYQNEEIALDYITRSPPASPICFTRKKEALPGLHQRSQPSDEQEKHSHTESPRTSTFFSNFGSLSSDYLKMALCKPHIARQILVSTVQVPYLAVKGA